MEKKSLNEALLKIKPVKKFRAKLYAERAKSEKKLWDITKQINILCH